MHDVTPSHGSGSRDINYHLLIITPSCALHGGGGGGGGGLKFM